MSAPKTTIYELPSSVAKVNKLYRLLAGHELLGLAPGEIAKGIGVSPSWVSQMLPALCADGFVEHVAGTNRWRLSVQFVRIATTTATNLAAAKRQLDDISHRYSVPL
jgi:ArsR family transcriptional regulator